MSEKTTTFSDLDNIFDNIIRTGYQSKEEEVIPGLKIILKPLNYNELCKAEAEINERNPSVPTDVTLKLRCGKILSYAIVTLNGVNIADDNMTYEEQQERRLALYIKLMKAPTIVIQKAYDMYLKTVAEETEFYLKNEEIGEQIENF